MNYVFMIRRETFGNMAIYRKDFDDLEEFILQELLDADRVDLSIRFRYVEDDEDGRDIRTDVDESECCE